MQEIGRRALERFSPQKFDFEIFPKTNAFSITFGPRYIHGQSLEEIDFPTRNAVDRCWRDSFFCCIILITRTSSRKKVVLCSFVKRNKKLICWFVALRDLKECCTIKFAFVEGSFEGSVPVYLSACRNLASFLFQKRRTKEMQNEST